MPAFATSYAAHMLNAARPWTDETLTIEPMRF
jgi:hypothetical protein